MSIESPQNERTLLLNVLQTARDYVTDILELDRRISECENAISAHISWGEAGKTREFYRKRTGITLTVCLAPIIFFLFMVTLGSVSFIDGNGLNRDVPTYFTLVALFTVGVCAVIFLIYRLIENIAIQKKIDSFIKEWHTTGVQKLNDLNAQRAALLVEKRDLIGNKAAATLRLLPPKYIYLEAIDYFVDVIINMRADSIKEAVNLYEEHLHRERMETTQHQIAEQQGKILRVQQENQAILNSFGHSLDAMADSTRNMSADTQTLVDLAMIQYLKQK